MATIKIELTPEHRGGGRSTSFSGRTEGEKVRKLLDLDKKDKNDNQYIIFIPEKTTALNPSFFLGLLFPSIKFLGLDKFLAKYSFNLDNLSEPLKNIIEDDILDGLRNASNELNLTTGLD